MTPFTPVLEVVELLDKLDKRIIMLGTILNQRTAVDPDIAELLNIAKTQQQLNRMLVRAAFNEEDVKDITGDNDSSEQDE